MPLFLFALVSLPSEPMRRAPFLGEGLVCARQCDRAGPQSVLTVLRAVIRGFVGDFVSFMPMLDYGTKNRPSPIGRAAMRARARVAAAEEFTTEAQSTQRGRDQWEDKVELRAGLNSSPARWGRHNRARVPRTAREPKADESCVLISQCSCCRTDDSPRQAGTRCRWHPAPRHSRNGGGSLWTPPGLVSRKRSLISRQLW